MVPDPRHAIVVSHRRRHLGRKWAAHLPGRQRPVGRSTGSRMWRPPEGFLANPGLVHAFYKPAPVPSWRTSSRMRPTGPWPGWEQHWPAGFLLVTQNVDDLHERAGSQNPGPHARGAAQGALPALPPGAALGGRHRGGHGLSPLRPERRPASPRGLSSGKCPWRWNGSRRRWRAAGRSWPWAPSGNVYPAARVRGSCRPRRPHAGTEPGAVPGKHPVPGDPAGPGVDHSAGPRGRVARESWVVSVFAGL